MRKITLIRFLLSVAVGAGVLSMPTAFAAQTRADDQVRAQGAQAWSNHCARCHNMREPVEFRDDQWRPIVAHMRIRAGLTGEDARAILLFLQSAN